MIFFHANQVLECFNNLTPSCKILITNLTLGSEERGEKELAEAIYAMEEKGSNFFQIYEFIFTVITVVFKLKSTQKMSPIL